MPDRMIFILKTLLYFIHQILCLLFLTRNRSSLQNLNTSQKSDIFYILFNRLVNPITTDSLILFLNVS